MKTAYTKSHQCRTVRSFLVLVREENGEGGFLRVEPEPSQGNDTWVLRSPDHRIEILVFCRNSEELPRIHDRFPSPDQVTLMIGDDSEWEEHPAECGAHSVTLEIDLTNSEFRVWTSIIGLPPVYIMEGKQFLVLTSDIHLLKYVAGFRPILDPKGAIELGRTGHPTEYGTLVKGLTFLPGGHKGEYRHTTGFRLHQSWKMPEENPVEDWRQFCQGQIAAFDRSMEKMKTEATFLSLTAGLDTRAIFSWFVKHRVALPACTMSGIDLSLDARIARMLCGHYGMQHQVITLGEEFFRNIVAYMTEASRLSGGIVSLGQSAEVYFYKQQDTTLTSRISGNLGNQVGRGGTEGISLRGADLGILNAEFLREHSDLLDRGHWFFNRGEKESRMSYRALLQYEVPHSSVANYSIGNNFAVQKSPYASRKLIVASCRELGGEGGASEKSLIRMRQRDLLHRFLGEPLVKSFQRQLIRDNGGYVSGCPINWGWRADGGISLPGILFGVLTGMDAFLSRHGSDAQSIALRKCLHVNGLHDFKNLGFWAKKYLGEYLADQVHSSGRAVDLFNKLVLQNKVKEVLGGKSSDYNTILYALDLILAQQNIGFQV